MSILDPDYKKYIALIEAMIKEEKIFVFIEKGQKKPPYELWTELQPVNKNLIGGVAIVNSKSGKILTKPSMSKTAIVNNFKKLGPTLDEKLVMKKLKTSDDYTNNYKVVHHGRFVPYIA